MELICLTSAFSAISAVMVRISYLVSRMSYVVCRVLETEGGLEEIGRSGPGPRGLSGGGAEPPPYKMIISVISVVMIRISYLVSRI